MLPTFSKVTRSFLSFNTNQKPRIKSPKSGDFENKNYIGRSPDPFSSCPNIKEEKSVRLRETMFIIMHAMGSMTRTFTDSVTIVVFLHVNVSSFALKLICET